MSVDLQRLTYLAGVIPISNVDDAKVVIENLSVGNIAICKTTKTTNITHGTHFHDSYEFVICNTSLPSCIIGDKVYSRTKNSLFAVNPMQEHGIAADLKGFNLCGVHIEKSIVRNVAMSIYGSSNIVFSNESATVNHDISTLVQLVLEELRYKQTGHEFMVENLILLLTGSFMRQIKHNLTSRPLSVIRSNSENIKKVIDYMSENYTSGISCTELSELINMDKFGFIRGFKAYTGKTPYEYLLDLKLEKAKKMLKANEYSITEISMLCGFSSHSHFTSTFKKKTGISPTKYRMSP